MKHYQKRLQQLSDQDQRRQLRDLLPEEGVYCHFDGQRLLNFSSNDYLGLNTDTTFKQDFEQRLSETAFFGSSSSSRLLTGNALIYREVEEKIGAWYDGKKALFFNSGYHANIGCLPALCDKGDLILADKLCHASLIDGIRLSSADYLRFRHNDVEQLADILAKKRHRYQRVFIVTESVFSMDGDFAPLRELVALKQQYEAYLYVDEAHAVGALGQQGRGLSEALGVLDDIDIMVCPMGKAMASLGAFVVTSPTLNDWLVNHARSLIFTTALPSINLLWSDFVIEHMPKLTEKRQHLQHLCHTAKHALQAYHLPVAQSYILPVQVEENALAVELADYLRQQGRLVFPIRPPTVPAKTARLRLSLTANMTEDDIISVITLIGQYLH